ncbi:CBO0543 family protein [Paenibacillus sp. S-38]|uniref:CBO0543 family protein n=1 Tax=Paenibacillus sp. S-38 TaxID=3416710 RepID=UPI003CFA925C
MTLVTLVCFLWAKGWKAAPRFHSTVLYMISANVLYFVFTTNYLLWAFVPDVPLYPIFNELLYTLIVFPCSVVLFLKGCPEEKGLPVWHYLKWVAFFAVPEALYAYTGHIAYGHGWSWGWSAAFDLMMFPMLWLHSRRPVLAYILSVGITTLLLYLFRVPLAGLMDFGGATTGGPDWLTLTSPLSSWFYEG